MQQLPVEAAETTAEIPLCIPLFGNSSGPRPYRRLVASSLHPVAEERSNPTSINVIQLLVSGRFLHFNLGMVLVVRVNH